MRTTLPISNRAPTFLPVRPVAKPLRAYAVGLDLGGTSIKAGLVHDQNGLLKKRDVLLRDRSPSAVLQALTDVTGELSRGIGGLRKLEGVGIVAPGTVDARNQRIGRSANFPLWREVEVGEHFRNITGFPRLELENDANGFALGVWRFEWSGALDNLVVFTLGTGVGGGLILNRTLWTGDTGFAGELGHLRVRERGRRCGCGSNGCLEQYASAKAFSRLATELRGRWPDSILTSEPLPTGREISRAARRGDPLSLEVYRRVGADLGRAAADLVNSLGVTTFSYGGKGSAAFPYFKEALRAAIESHCGYLNLGKRLQISRSRLGATGGILGAASLILTLPANTPN